MAKSLWSKKTPEKREYILWIIKGDEVEGYTGMRHGWSKNLVMTAQEAKNEKERIESMFDCVDIEIHKI